MRTPVTRRGVFTRVGLLAAVSAAGCAEDRSDHDPDSESSRPSDETSPSDAAPSPFDDHDGWTELARRAGVETAAWSGIAGPRTIVDGASNGGAIGLVGHIAGGRDGGTAGVLWSDFESGDTGRTALHSGLTHDDRCAPALARCRDGRYLAVYVDHHADTRLRWRRSERPADPTAWTEEAAIDVGAPASLQGVYRGDTATYAFVTGSNGAPTAIRSTDDGTSWSVAGRIVGTTSETGVAVARYAGAADAVHVLVTDGTVSDGPTGLYHGVLSDGAIGDSHGSLVAEAVPSPEGRPPESTDLTPVSEAGNTVEGVELGTPEPVAVTVDGGRPRAIFTARTGDEQDDRRFVYARFGPGGWGLELLARSGAPLTPLRPSETGLAAIDPTDSDRVVVSTPIDPRDGSSLEYHALFVGDRSPRDGWSWTALTTASGTADIRPVMTAADDERSWLTWMSGRYQSSRAWDTTAVAGSDRPSDAVPYYGPPGVNRTPRVTAPAVRPGDVAHAIDVGGRGGTVDGIVYRRDAGGVGGVVWRTDGPIEGTDAPWLFRTYRVGSSFAYALPLQPGRYTLAMYCVDDAHVESGHRTFDVRIDGETVIEAIDIVGAVGRDAAYEAHVPFIDVDEERTVTIGFEADRHAATLSGLRLVRTA